MNRRIYLCGAVDKLDDLGIGWRRKAAGALLPVGLEPVWPVDLLDLHNERVTTEQVRRSWRDRIEVSQRYGYDHPLIVDCQILGGCAGVLVYWSAEAGLGTRAELGIATAIGRPVVAVVPGDTYEGNDLREAYEVHESDRFDSAARNLAHLLEATP